jgi:hypothetical protein
VVVIAPSLLDEPVPPAFQLKAIILSPLLFTPLSAPTVKPSLSKAVKPVVFVFSPSVVFDCKAFCTPLVLSYQWWS